MTAQIVCNHYLKYTINYSLALTLLRSGEMTGERQHQTCPLIKLSCAQHSAGMAHIKLLSN